MDGMAAKRYIPELVLQNKKDWNIQDLKIFSPAPFLPLAYKSFAMKRAKSEPMWGNRLYR